MDTHALHLPPQESWATYYDTAGEASRGPPVISRTRGDSSTEAFHTDREE